MTDMIEFAKRVLQDPGDDGFERTMELRIFGVGAVLEQRWRKPKIGSWDRIVGWEYQWRSVPHVYGEA